MQFGTVNKIINNSITVSQIRKVHEIYTIRGLTSGVREGVTTDLSLLKKCSFINICTILLLITSQGYVHRWKVTSLHLIYSKACCYDGVTISFVGISAGFGMSKYPRGPRKGKKRENAGDSRRAQIARCMTYTTLEAKRSCHTDFLSGQGAIFQLCSLNDAKSEIIRYG